MKKVFAILAVVAFVACNSGENKEGTKDTTAPAASETPAGENKEASKDTSAPAKASTDTSKKGTK